MTEPTRLPTRDRAEVDWNKRAGTKGLGLLRPATEAVLANLPPQAGGVVLDLACGLGSPTFEAARRNPGARVLGVDRADKVIAAARGLAAADGIENAQFEVMSLDALTLPDNSVDAAISQFGFLHEGDLAASTRELSRVLKGGAPFSVITFEAMKLNTFVSAAVSVLERHVPGRLPDFGYLTQVATPGLRERLLREAGISTLHSQTCTWKLELPSAAALWLCVSEPVPFGQAMSGLAPDELESIRAELEQASAEFRSVDGSYAFPMGCRLFWGNK
ncbi:MAG: class I SAM-dependent methyltransferase [Polyangiaceae bacterium]|nr:class I SAM-dependent methyltransferase [Polyangiaceae bacterium]